MKKKIRFIADVYPEWIPGWHPKNGKRSPQNTPIGSKLLFWWQCGMGHEWRATIAQHRRQSACPKCHSQNTSFGELFFYYHLRQLSYPCVHRADVAVPGGKSFEIDVFIPSLRLAFEYDGYHHANRPMMAKAKTYLLAQSDVHFIRVVTVQERQNDIVVSSPTQTNPSEGPLQTPEKYLELMVDEKNPLSYVSCLRKIGGYLKNCFPLSEADCETVSEWNEVDVETFREKIYPKLRGMNALHGGRM